MFLSFTSCVKEDDLNRYDGGEHPGGTWNNYMAPTLEGSVWILSYIRGAGSFDFPESHPNDTIRFYNYDADYISSNTGTKYGFHYTLSIVPNTYTKELRFSGFPLFSNMPIAITKVQWLNDTQNFISAGKLFQVKFTTQIEAGSNTNYYICSMVKI
jgi:hypothetical protein